MLVHQTISIHGNDICVTMSEGRGPSLVMIHGSASNRMIFDRQLDSFLADQYRLIVLDLPGHGESSDAQDPRVSYPLPALARTVSETLDQLGVASPTIFGWSLGGHIGLEMLSFRTDIKGLMISGTPPIGHGPWGTLRAFRISRDAALASKEHFSAQEVERFARLCFDDHVRPVDLLSIARADGRLRRIMFSSMMLGQCADERQIVATTETPIAMVNGANDPLLRTSYIEGLRYRTMWKGAFHTIPDAGHDAFRQRAGVFNRLLSRFVEDVNTAVPRQPVAVEERLIA